MIKIHHLNCGTLCPSAGGWIFRGTTNLVCHCLLLETPKSLMLVDTGFGLLDCSKTHERLGLSYKLIGPALNPEESAYRQIEGKGLDPRAVTDILLTHLDFDHAGGISDFPWARVHVLQDEHSAAMTRGFSFLNLQRYRPEQWQGHSNWAFHNPIGESWFGFEKIQPLDGFQDEILMIPLPGHTKGHAGFAIHSQKGWIFHAGDCYYSHVSMNEQNFRIPKQLESFEKLAAFDNEMRLQNVGRLRQLAKDYRGSVDVFCAHDPFDLNRFD